MPIQEHYRQESAGHEWWIATGRTFAGPNAVQRVCGVAIKRSTRQISGSKALFLAILPFETADACEPGFDLIEPRRVGEREMEMTARTLLGKIWRQMVR